MWKRLDIAKPLGNISGNGNPSFDPLMSTNYDASFEWYPNDDTILAIGGYYKTFQGGFETIVQSEEFDINGVLVDRDVTVTQTSDDTSNLAGVEITASHGFTYLPTQTASGIIAPGNLPGLSENVISAQVYYGIGGLDLAVNYKYRDDYFQPFISDGTRLRYVGDVGVWEARASYTINDNFRLSAEAINLFSEPKEQFAFVRDDRYEINDYGPRIFFGIRGRF